MVEFHFLHHAQPLVACLTNRGKGDFDIAIWRVVKGFEKIKCDLDFHDIEAHDVKALSKAEKEKQTVHVELLFESSDVPSHDMIDNYLSEYDFYDSELADHQCPEVPFRIDIGGFG